MREISSIIILFIGLNVHSQVPIIFEYKMDSEPKLFLTLDSTSVFDSKTINFKVDSGNSIVHRFVGGYCSFGYTNMNSENNGILIVYESKCLQDCPKDSLNLLPKFTKKRLRKVVIKDNANVQFNDGTRLSKLTYKKTIDSFGLPQNEANNRKNQFLSYNNDTKNTFRFHFDKGKFDFLEILYN